jgi:hypothetical protein
MNAKVLEYAFESLTAYDYLQVQGILKWRQNPSSILANLSGEALSPLQTVTGALIPKSFLKKAVHLVEASTDNWHQEWETLKQEAKVDDLCQGCNPPSACKFTDSNAHGRPGRPCANPRKSRPTRGAGNYLFASSN